MINFKNYEILKTISEQLRLLSWAIGGVYGILNQYFGIFPTLVFIIYNWAIIQFYSIYILNVAQKYKKE